MISLDSVFQWLTSDCSVNTSAQLMAYGFRPVVESALTLMRQRPARTLGEVARLCGVSRHTLIRAFRRSGPAPAAEVRSRELWELMTTLMRDSSAMTIAEISDTLGFATPRSFARWVKRASGRSPRVLRDELCDCADIEHGAAVERPGVCETRKGSGMPPGTARTLESSRGRKAPGSPRGAADGSGSGRRA